MPQTERTTAQIQSLLANNTTGDISPQDLRDAIATVLGGYASILLTVSGAPATKTGVAQTPLVITEYDLIGSQSVDANVGGASASAATGEITIGQTGLYWVSFFASFFASANNVLVHFHPFIDNAVGLVKVDRFLSTGADVGVVSMGAVVPYSEGAEVDIRIFVGAGTTDITFEAMVFSVHRVG